MIPTRPADNDQFLFINTDVYAYEAGPEQLARWENEQAQEWMEAHDATSVPIPVLDDLLSDPMQRAPWHQPVPEPRISNPQPKPIMPSRSGNAATSEIDAAVQRKMDNWRAQKVKGNPLARIAVAEEIEAEKHFREIVEAERGERVFSDSIDDLIKDAQDNPAVPVVEKMIHVGDRVVIHGYEETQKSFVVITLGDSIATGRPWLGAFQIPKKMIVGIIETEMRNPGLGERLAKMYEGRDRPKNLHFLSQRKLKEFRRAPTVEARFKIIQDWVKFHQIEVVLIDVISDVFTGRRSPDKEEDVSFVFDQLDLITGVKVWVLVRHDAKPREGGNDSNSNNAIRGSSEWKENPETILHLTKDGRSDAVKLSVGKLRYGRKPKPFAIRYDAKDGTIVPENPVLWVLAKGAMTREQLIQECRERYHVSESMVDKWLKEVKEHLEENHEGHKKVFARKTNSSADLLWRYDDPAQ